MRQAHKLLSIVLLLLYTTVFVFVESNASIFGFDQVQSAAGLALVLVFTLAYLLGNRMTSKTRARFMVLLGILGIIFSVLMTYAHFASASSFCPAAAKGGVPCDIVNKSVYSEIFGVPVAVLGILGYAIITYLAYLQCKKQREGLLYDPLSLHLLTIGALGFTVWLNYIQFAVLMTLCLYCEMSAATVLALTLLSYQNWRDA